MSDPVELAQAISRTLGNLRFQEKDVKIFFGRVRSVEYPFMVVYFPLFTSSTADQNFYADIHAEIVIEFAYAAETDDLELYEFADSIIEPLKKGLQYKRHEKSYIITPNDDFEHRIVDGYLQISFSANYQVDTVDKIAYDNAEKMGTLDLTFESEGNK